MTVFFAHTRLHGGSNRTMCGDARLMLRLAFKGW